jgi:hypothetical protein
MCTCAEQDMVESGMSVDTCIRTGLEAEPGRAMWPSPVAGATVGPGGQEPATRHVQRVTVDMFRPAADGGGVRGPAPSGERVGPAPMETAVGRAFRERKNTADGQQTARVSGNPL